MDGVVGLAGKLMRHGCGYPFRVRVLTQLNDFIVIEYRDACRMSLPYYHCPCCDERLQLWWQVPPATDGIGGVALTWTGSTVKTMWQVPPATDGIGGEMDE